MSLKITRAEATALHGIAYGNLRRSVLELNRATDEDSLYVSVTSDEAPGALILYEIFHSGTFKVVKKENFIPDLVKQDTDDPED